MGRDSVKITERNTNRFAEIRLIDIWHEDENYTEAEIKVIHKEWLGDRSLMVHVDTYPVGKNTDEPFYYSESELADFENLSTVLTGDGVAVLVESGGNEIKITPSVASSEAVEHGESKAFERHGYSAIEFTVNHPVVEWDGESERIPLEELIEMYSPKTKAYMGIQ